MLNYQRVSGWLVVWNIIFIDHNIYIYIYGIILPIDELIFFRMVKTPNHSVFLFF